MTRLWKRFEQWRIRRSDFKRADYLEQTAENLRADGHPQVAGIADLAARELRLKWGRRH